MEKEGQNFVNMIIEKGKGGIIQVPDDEFALPTSAAELSKVIIRLIQKEQENLPCSLRRSTVQPL